MTEAQKLQLKAMTGKEVFDKYHAMVKSGTCTWLQFRAVMKLWRDLNPSQAAETAPESSKQADVVDDTAERLVNAFGGEIVETTHTDKAKGGTQKERLLAALADKEWHTTLDLFEKVYGAQHLGSSRLAARIQDLRDDGYKIDSRKNKGAIWEYKLSV